MKCTTDIIPDGRQMTVNMNDVEMRDSAVALSLPGLGLTIIYIDALGKRVYTENLWI